MIKRHIASFILVALLFTHALAASFTREPTSNQSPDATLGGVAVTTPTNTGHASTVASASGPGAQTKSCRWFSFQSASGQIKSITLKITHTSQGVLANAGGNTFTISYSLNGGSSWTNAVNRVNFTTSEGPTTFSVALSAGQDISQIQVRDLLDANAPGAGDSASVTATVSDIKLEIVTVDHPVIVMW